MTHNTSVLLGSREDGKTSQEIFNVTSEPFTQITKAVNGTPLLNGSPTITDDAGEIIELDGNSKVYQHGEKLAVKGRDTENKCYIYIKNP